MINRLQHGIEDFRSPNNPGIFLVFRFSTGCLAIRSALCATSSLHVVSHQCRLITSQLYYGKGERTKNRGQRTLARKKGDGGDRHKEMAGMHLNILHESPGCRNFTCPISDEF